MSKGLKKITKIAAKFDLGHQYGKAMGLPDPSGDLFYGKNKALSPAERADELAKTQNAFAEKQAAQATAEAQQQAIASTQAIQMQSDRQRADATVADLGPPVDNTPVVVDAAAPSDPAAKRKRFTSTSTNAGEGGPAIRI